MAMVLSLQMEHKVLLAFPLALNEKDSGSVTNSVTYNVANVVQGLKNY